MVQKLRYRILTPVSPLFTKFLKSLNVFLWNPEFPNENVNNGSQFSVQKNAPNAKHRLCIKLMKVAKILYKTESFKKERKKIKYACI